MLKPTQYQLSQATNGTTPAKRFTGNNKGLTQAYEFRELAHKEAMELHECVCTSLEQRVTRARALKDLNSVWYAASERIRIIKGKPMPGSLRPIAKPKKVRLTSTVPLEQLPTMAQVKDEGDRQGGKRETLSSKIVSTPACTEPDSISTGKAEPPDSIGDKHALNNPLDKLEGDGIVLPRTP